MAKDLVGEFLAFHKKNPRVYDMFKSFTRRAIESGRKNFGVSAVWERMRWEMEIELHPSADPFKLNNNHRAYYARLFMADHPEHAGFFRTRRVRGL